LTRLVSGEPQALEHDRALRPQTLAEFVGQAQAKGNLKVFIDARAAAARRSTRAAVRSAGLGKTTLAQIVARELGVNFRATSGPVLAKAGDLAAILTNLEPRDVLFIDEIHRLGPAVEEILYPAMEDHVLDLIIGEGPVRPLDPDRAGALHPGRRHHARRPLATPLRDRFGIPLRLEFYTPQELKSVLLQAARKLGADLTEEGRPEIAARSRGTPRSRPPAAPRARLRGAEQIDRKRAASALARWRWTRPASTASTAATSAPDRELRRRPGRGGDARRRYRRGSRRGGGRDRALPAAAGLHLANAPRPHSLPQAYGHIGLTPPPRAPGQPGLFEE
jgi:Holliday junction DNA helicase RuvB